MKILSIHSDFFEFSPVKKAVKEAEPIVKERKRIEECLVLFIAVEETDEDKKEVLIERALQEISDLSGKVGSRNLVLYPWVHLTPTPSSPSYALIILKELEEKLSAQGYRVTRAPFGWYKEFNIKCKGHPLSELSRQVIVEEEKKEEIRIKTKKFVLTPSGEEVNVEEYVFKPEEHDFKCLVEREALKSSGETKSTPEFLKICRKYGIEWESYSDLGHMRYGPEASIMFDLVGMYSEKVALSLGYSLFNVKGTNMFDLSVPSVKEHAKLFGSRLYSLKSEKKNLVLRYAACHQQFSMLKDWNISYRNLPLAVFEVADSYRLEQSGELLLCFRTRKLHMPDLHILCRDLSHAEKEALKVHSKIYEEIRKLGRDYVSIYNVSEKFYSERKSFIGKLVELEGKPVLINLVPDGIYYWVINVEYNIIDQLNRPREIGTFQIDIGNAKRFGIQFVDRDGLKKYPVIIHTALIGSVERYLYTVFDTAVKMKRKGEKPALPTWLAPIQVRVIPVASTYLNKALEVAEKLKGQGIRVDVDDSDETLNYKVMRAEREWIPYIIVLGEKELKKNILSVRMRKENRTAEFSVEEFTRLIEKELNGYPRREMTMPIFLSKRPVYNP